MIFDAFGRLALGQVGQDFTKATVHLSGVSASGLVGSIVPTKLTLVNLTGVSGTATAGSFGGASIPINGTPIGALLTVTLGTPVLAGNGNKIVSIVVPGVFATGKAAAFGANASPLGILLTITSGSASTGASASVAVNLLGVTGFGSAGSLGNVQSVPVPGVAATCSLGTIIPLVSGFSFTGVSAVGSTSDLTFVFGGVLGGVQATGLAGAFNTDPGSGTTVISGGGGGKKPRTGLEPIAKRPPAPPIPVKLPTYVVPNFKPKAPPPAPPIARTPFERSPGIAPLDLMGMRQQIQSAQDEADIKAVLAHLDALD